MSNRRFIGNTRGSALLSTLLIGVLLIAAVAIYQNWISQYTRASIHRMTTGNALSVAEGGVAQAMDALRIPGGPVSLPGQTFQTTYTVSFGSSSVNQLAYVTMSRDPNDSTLVILISSGIYQSGNTSKTAIIHAKVRALSLSGFFAVVPTSLQIAYGTDLSQASVYARDLQFLLPTPASTTNTPTKIGSAYYFSSIQPTQIDPSLVQFITPPQQLTAEPNLVVLDITLRQYYQAWAGSSILTSNQDLSSSLVAPGNTYGVYYCPGDLSLAGSSDLSVSGPVVVYATGTVTINGNISAVNGGWLTVIAEGGISLSAQAPDSLTIAGTFVTGGTFQAALPSAPRAGTLSLTGGFQAGGGAQFSSGWPNRSYIYQPAPASMPLPFFLAFEEYKVIQGKFNQ